jgi:hypothetical protein
MTTTVVLRCRCDGQVQFFKEGKLVGAVQFVGEVQFAPLLQNDGGEDATNVSLGYVAYSHVWINPLIAFSTQELSFAGFAG